MSMNVKTGGGSHRNCLSMMRYLIKQGHQVSLHVLFSLHNDLPSDIKTTVYKAEQYGFLAFESFLANLLSKLESKADIFFLYGQFLIFGGGLYRGNAHSKVPVVAYLDNYLDSMRYKTRNLAESTGNFLTFIDESFYTLKRVIYDKVIGINKARNIDSFLAVSPFVRNLYIRFGFPREKFKIVPNFFNPVLKHNKAKDETSCVRFLYVGQLSYDKGVDVFLKALARLPTEAHWEARIVGSGRYEKMLKNITQKLGIHNRVFYIPWLPENELADEYASASVLIHPARWSEPFGRTIVEAMQQGIPVVVPEKGGSVWVAGNAGLSFKNGSVTSLHSVLLRFLNDSSLRQSLAINTSARAEEFEISQQGSEFEKVFINIIESIKPPMVESSSLKNNK